jgi:murein DD-endopeptidase MepM/ murein hydrolase activator NlpD
MKSCFKGKFKVTSPRAYRTLNGKKEYHGGLDLVALEDKTVYAIADGKVDAVPYEANGFGYYVRQLLPDGRRIYYGHLAKGSIQVKKGQSVKQGDKLGTMGSTGKSTGPHTHIELRPKGTKKESLDISEFTGIPNKKGTYEATAKTKHEIAYECACRIEKVCSLSKDTINYLWKYKYADDLFIKLWEGMK